MENFTQKHLDLKFDQLLKHLHNLYICICIRIADLKKISINVIKIIIKPSKIIFRFRAQRAQIIGTMCVATLKLPTAKRCQPPAAENCHTHQRNDYDYGRII